MYVIMQRMAGFGKKLLIIDDEPTFIEVLRAHLEFKGYDVDSASSGEEALTKIAYQDFDVVLLDIMMPNIDGYQFMQHLRAEPRTRELPVIVMTAVPRFRGEKRMDGFKVAGYLEKPFEHAELLALIERCLASPTKPLTPPAQPKH